MKKVYGIVMLLVGVLFISAESLAQYCTPSTSSSWGRIKSVKTLGGDINISKTAGTGYTGYKNYTTTDSVSVDQGRSFTMEVERSYALAIYVDWNDDGDFFDSGEQIRRESTTSGSITKISQNITVPTTSAKGALRIRVITGNGSYNTPCPSRNWAGGAQDYRLFVTTPKQVDIGVAAMNPSTHCAGSQAVKVDVFNYGTDTIKSFTIEGKVGTTSFGPTTVTGVSIPWLGTYSHTLGNYTFTNGVKVDIKAWTSSPNAGTDSLAKNDTLFIKNFQPAYNGSYTVGLSTSDDFSSIKDAIDALVANGVCGPVRLMLNDSQAYNERVSIPAIPGATAVNTVTIISNPSNSNMAVWEATGTSSQNYTVEFDGASYINIDSVILKSKSTSYGRVVHFKGGDSWISFSNDSLIAAKRLTTSTFNAVVYDEVGSDYSENITFRNNYLVNGSFSFYIIGSGTSRRQKNWTLENNTMVDWYYRGVHSYYGDGYEFRGNTIIGLKTGGYQYGPSPMYMYYNYNTNVKGNKMVVYSNNYGYGCYYYYARATSSKRKVFANNMISVLGSGTSSNTYGLRTQSTDYVDLLHNSVYVEKGGSSARAFYIGTATSCNFKNNAVKNNGSGYSLYFNSSSTSSPSRGYNAYFGGRGMRYATGTGTINADPKYEAADDLHASSTLLHNAADSNFTDTVGVDFDGDIRCPLASCPGNGNAPDIGADEYWLADYDIAPAGFCSNPCSGTQDVMVTIRNKGVKTLTSFKVDWWIGTTAQTQLVVTGISVAAGKDTCVKVGTNNFVTGTTYDFKFVTSNPSGQTDQIKDNDTVKVAVQNSLSGTLTVGTGGDFVSLDTAAKTLTKLGVCGPVVLQVMDSTFIENVTFENIGGNSSINTISVVNHPANTKDAIIEGSITFKGVTHFTIKGLVFNKSGNKILFGGAKVTNLRIDSNTFNLGTSGYALYDNIRSVNMDSMWFVNNTVNGGTGGLYFQGASSGSVSTREANIFIENNKIEGFVQYGVYYYYTANMSFRGNVIKSGKGLTSYPYIIYGWYGNNFEFKQNQMNSQGTNGGYGMYMFYTNRFGSTNSDSLILENNFISSSHTNSDFTHYGAYLYYNYRIRGYHNNFNVESSYSRAYGLYTYRCRDVNMKNNIFGAAGGTTWFENFSSNVVRDYNAYWNGTTGVSGISGGTLGSNSIITNPRYKKPKDGDLRVNSIQLDSGGVNLGITTDVFNSTRKNPPDIGAHEFDPCYYDAVAKEYYARYVQIPNTQSVRMYGTVGNIGLDSITGVNANGAVGTSTATLPLGTILSDGDSSFSIAVPLTGVTGVVNASLYTTMNQTDCDSQNDTLRYSFEATDTVYAYDDSVFTGGLGFNFPGTGEFGNVFEIFNTDTITSGTFHLDAPPQGATVRLVVYNIIDSTGLPGSVVDSTRSFVVGKNGAGWYTLQFGCEGIIAKPGKYLVCVDQPNPVNMSLSFNGNGTSVVGTRFFRSTGGSWTDFDTQTGTIKNAILGIRVNLGKIAENDVLPATSLICNNSSTYLKLNKKYDRQIWSNGLLFDSILVSSPGVYKVTAWDAIGCMFTDSTIATKATPMMVTGTPTKATCGMSDGSISLSVTGAYPPHTYSWNNGDTSKNINGVAGDDYTVVITDSIGCKNTQTVKVLGAFPIVSNSWTYPTCNGDNNGTATSVVNKGVMPYSYKWNTGGSTNTATNTGLPSGKYVVDVTDASGCVTKDTVEVKDAPVLVSNNVVIAPSACKLADASAEAQMNGGLAPYKFLWSNGQTSGKAVGLTEGVYDVTISDSLGCVVISKMRVTDPNSPISIPNDQLLDCSYDTTTVKVNIQGGTAPFNYTWDYRNMKTSTISGVASGRYKLHLVDAKGCDHDTIVVIAAPSAINVTFDNLVDSAGVNKATATTTGGSPAYSWNWTPSGETTQRAVSLKPGLNKVTVVDAKGCSFTYQLSVTSTTTSVSYLNNPAVFNIFPNPTQGNVNVDLNLTSEDNVRIRVLNSVGKVVQTIEKDNVIQDRITIDLSDYSVGIYLVETTIGSEKVVSRIQLTK